MDGDLLLEVVHRAATFIVEGPTTAECRETVKPCQLDGLKDTAKRLMASCS